jgi:hypothetical protein
MASSGNITLSTPAIQINNETYKIVPNSFVYDGGEGEIIVRSASAGGGSVTSVHSENAETKISFCKFDIYLLSGVDKDIATWKSNIGSNNIKALQRTSGGESETKSFDNMSCTAPVERQASADGVTSLEFKGDPMSNQ